MPSFIVLFFLNWGFNYFPSFFVGFLSLFSTLFLPSFILTVIFLLFYFFYLGLNIQMIIHQQPIIFQNKNRCSNTLIQRTAKQARIESHNPTISQQNFKKKKKKLQRQRCTKLMRDRSTTTSGLKTHQGKQPPRTQSTLMTSKTELSPLDPEWTDRTIAKGKQSGLRREDRLAEVTSRG